jgi:putative ABC transport system permease protein
MFWLAWRNLIRRPWRTLLTLGGLGMAVAVLASLAAFGQGYRSALGAEINRMGLQLMLVPLGCPYEAAAQVLKGRTLENSLPESALALVRQDPAVAVAAPLLLAAVPRQREHRTDMWVGIDDSILPLKPWWQVKEGRPWFSDSNSVILGAEAASVEMRTPGDKFFSPETERTLRVSGVLDRSGTSDDSLFFVPLAAAQAMFGQKGRLTAVAIRLHDPGLLAGASERLQRIPGAQVVTLTEMMGTFLNLVGAVRTLLLAIAIVAVAISALGVFNTLLAAVVERTAELAIMRAIGASRLQVFVLVSLESLLLTGLGSAIGLALAALLGPAFEQVVKQWVPLAPTGQMSAITGVIALQAVGIGLAVGLIAGIYPACQASRLQPAAAVKME